MQYDLGILGGGQLARMSVQAAQRMGLSCVVLDPDPACPAAALCPHLVGPLDDPEHLVRLMRSCGAVTLENEFVSALAVEKAMEAAGRSGDPRVMPSPRSLGLVQDKLVQREAYAEALVPSPRFAAEPSEAVVRFGFPLVVKSRRLGYDGKGTRTVRNQAELDELRLPSGAWYAEEHVAFRRELAVMVCRWPEGSCCFPTMESRQVDHVCDLVLPAMADASAVALRAVEALEGHGLFGVELFELHDGTFVVNEVAPRPHNSGHYTLDWGGVSQFEAHVRLAMGWTVPEPVGGPTCMANLLAVGFATGTDLHERVLAGTRAAYAAAPGCHVHWYGKAEARPGRKVGHLNAPSVEEALVARAAFWAEWTN